MASFDFHTLYVVCYPGPHCPQPFDERVYTDRVEAEKVAAYARKAKGLGVRPYKDAKVLSLGDFISDVRTEALDATRGDHCW